MFAAAIKKVIFWRVPPARENFMTAERRGGGEFVLTSPDVSNTNERSYQTEPVVTLEASSER